MRTLRSIALVFTLGCASSPAPLPAHPTGPGGWGAVTQGVASYVRKNPVPPGGRYVELEVCADQTGHVTRATAKNAAEDDDAVKAARKTALQMGFRPHLENGVPQPLCREMGFIMQWLPASDRRVASQISEGTKLLPPTLGRGLCVSCPDPALPDAAGTRKAPIITKICVGTDGAVTKVDFMGSGGPE